MFLLDNGLLNGGTNNACHVHEFNFVFRSIWQALFDSDRILRTLRARQVLQIGLNSWTLSISISGFFMNQDGFTNLVPF